MVQIYLNLTSRPGRTAEMVQALRSIASSAQMSSPVVRCAVYAEVGSANDVCYSEEWPGPEELRQRIRSVAFQRLLAIIETAAAPPVLEFRFADEIRGLDYVAEVRADADGQGLPASWPEREETPCTP